LAPNRLPVAEGAGVVDAPGAAPNKLGAGVAAGALLVFPNSPPDDAPGVLVVVAALPNSPPDGAAGVVPAVLPNRLPEGAATGAVVAGAAVPKSPVVAGFVPPVAALPKIPALAGAVDGVVDAVPKIPAVAGAGVAVVPPKRLPVAGVVLAPVLPKRPPVAGVPAGVALGAPNRPVPVPGVLLPNALVPEGAAGTKISIAALQYRGILTTKGASSGGGASCPRRGRIPKETTSGRPRARGRCAKRASEPEHVRRARRAGRRRAPCVVVF
jgi:hypothetical protein